VISKNFAKTFGRVIISRKYSSPSICLIKRKRGSISYSWYILYTLQQKIIYSRDLVILYLYFILVSIYLNLL
jgi:hypothetical protein